ncbi:hypothetical protein GPJ56_001510 [Histomonas meleagridis]|uniref:uncharacterized protein n=1 Tax=Histomonas meleagridis TaxID=135588 RepID=UPI00355A93C1|nr:hypothetical protein GPJ56_001510 [Histomonas meleagridis]KAH0807016.1 hypothetical protein GO595_000192 [Histomonas meleagridis]
MFQEDEILICKQEHPSNIELMDMLAENRSQNAQSWRDQNIGLLEKSIQEIKESIEKEYQRRYDLKKKEIQDRVFHQFGDLLKQFGKEIEEYIKLIPPERQQLHASLSAEIQKPAKNQQQINISKTTTPSSVFQEDFSKIISQMQADGVNTNSMTIIADRAMFYHDQVFFQGNSVSVETRMRNKLSGTIDSITKGEIEISFKDNSVLSISDIDLKEGRVVLYPA